MTEQVHQGQEYNTCVGYRLAISAFHNPIDSCKIGGHSRVSCLLKGIFNLKPPKPRHPLIWEVDQVLNYLKNLTVGNNLKNFAYKLLILLALTTASRASEITHLDIRYMLKSPLFYYFTLTKPIKVMKPGDSHPKIMFKGFEDNKDLCVARL